MSKPKLQVKIRRRWRINPQTRVEKSAKVYSRSRAKKQARKAIKNANKKTA